MAARLPPGPCARILIAAPAPPPPQATALTAQSYRKVVTTARRDKKAGAGPRGITEEQKQEIRCAPRAAARGAPRSRRGR